MSGSKAGGEELKVNATRMKTSQPIHLSINLERIEFHREISNYFQAMKCWVSAVSVK
jgi:hypothetical protein